MLNLLITWGRWAEGKRDAAILRYVKENPKATAGEIAAKFGINHHQAVTGILRENGIKRPSRQSTGSPLADAAREAGIPVKVVDLNESVGA